MNKIVKNTLILTAITLISGIGLGAVYEVTKTPIAEANEKAKNEAYKQVIAEADTFEEYDEFDEKQAEKVLEDAGLSGNFVNEVAVAKAGNEEVGYVITVTSKEGYGGEIKISTGILSDGTVNGIAILSISETAGLGMKATEPVFYDQFSGKNVEQFEVVKNQASSDEQIDALSGATITSKAVTGDVNAALVYFQNVIGGSADE